MGSTTQREEEKQLAKETAVTPLPDLWVHVNLCICLICLRRERALLENLPSTRLILAPVVKI